MELPSSLHRQFRPTCSTLRKRCPSQTCSPNTYSRRTFPIYLPRSRFTSSCTPDRSPFPRNDIDEICDGSKNRFRRFHRKCYRWKGCTAGCDEWEGFQRRRSRTWRKGSGVCESRRPNRLDGGTIGRWYILPHQAEMLSKTHFRLLGAMFNSGQSCTFSSGHD